MKKVDKPLEAPPREDKVPLQLPHERDEDTDMTDNKPDPKILQAYEDLKQGQVDTDMRATPGLDAQKRQRDVPGAGGKPLHKDVFAVRRK